MKTSVRALVLAAAMTFGSGCTEGLRGVRTTAPAATGKIMASVTTGEPDGLLVLWDDASPTHREVHHTRAMAWVAGNEEEFEEVWKAAVSGKPPRVNFARHVVFARLYEGNYADPRIHSIDVETSGLLLARFAHQPMMDYLDNVEPMARVIAVPRRILPTAVVFFEGYAFEVPAVPLR